MGDEVEELSDKEKLKIANNFVFNSPPGQVQKVFDDVRTLLGSGLLTKSVEQQMGTRVNKEQFLAVSVPDSQRTVLLTQAGELENGNFLDPDGKQELVIDHSAQQCTGTQALSPAAREIWSCGEGIEDSRKSIDEAMQRYTEASLPGATVTTYGRTVNGQEQASHLPPSIPMAALKEDALSLQFTCCVGNSNVNLGSFWAGDRRRDRRVEW